MHPKIEIINSELTNIVAALKAIGSNEPLNIAHGGWNIPGVTRDEFVGFAENLLLLISEREADELMANEELISDYPRRLVFLRENTIPQLWSSNAAQAAPAFLVTIQSLKEALEKALPEKNDLAEQISQARTNAKLAATRLRALEARILDMEPRSKTIHDMLDRIEKANDAADRLPVDLQDLKEAGATIKELLSTVTINSGKIDSFVKAADADKTTLNSRVTEADAIVAHCSAAYAASTSHGLAAAFTERSTALAKSMWVWVAGLVIALVLGSLIGSNQLHNFSEVIRQPNPNSTIAIINLLLALLSVGATVWFAWLATKQVGQRFRLAEDYAFKASVSRAYEGYRREAANIDDKFVSRLFSSALSRLDEQPLRLVETTTHGSPWHELASSDLLKKATELVPNFTSSVTELARDGLSNLKSTRKNFRPVKNSNKESTNED